jgi:glycosyltransferase involved in cell wall biosynthesis
MYSDYIICVSKFTADHLPSYLRSLPHTVIYYGVDHELFRPRDKEKVRKILGLPINRPIILNVGSEEPRKNIPTLLKAFRKVVEKIPRAILVRIGAPERSSLKLIEFLGLSGKVLYRRATESEIALYYNAADLLVHPAYYEGFGFPLIEAMASGTPIVAAYAAAIPEIVGNAAILVNPFDIDGLAISIVDLLSNKSLLQDLVERVFSRSAMFSWEKTAAQTIEVYEKLSRS